MADTVREIERKYEPPGDNPTPEDIQLPDLTGVPGVAEVADKGVDVLDATYYDTAERRLSAAGITLRRRTGGGDAGWHLKLPVAPAAGGDYDDPATRSVIRDEIRAPLADEVPRRLTGLLRSRIRDAELSPLVRVESQRAVRHLLDADGALLAEISADRVRATRLVGEEGSAGWSEIEAELGENQDAALLDAIERELLRAGLRRSAAPSKLARALAETDPERPEPEKSRAKSDKKNRKKGAGKSGKSRKSGKGAKKGAAEQQPKNAPTPEPPAPEPPPVSTAGDHVLGYLRAQVTAIIEYDPAVRRDLPDSVHRMRVATRRLRSAFRSYGKVLDRATTDPIGEELKWLAGELGIDRDREVLTERIQTRLGELDRPLLQGPVRGRLRVWSNARRQGTRRRLIAVLDGRRYLALLETLDALLAAPPFRDAAARPPEGVLTKAVLRDFGRLVTHVEQALAEPPGPDRDLAMHDARKAAKRTRYAAEAARSALGRPAKRFAGRMTEVQELLGDHQDSVVVRGALREIAGQAHAAGESAFTYGVMYAREEAIAAARERALPELWVTAAEPIRQPEP